MDAKLWIVSSLGAATAGALKTDNATAARLGSQCATNEGAGEGPVASSKPRADLPLPHFGSYTPTNVGANMVGGAIGMGIVNAIISADEGRVMFAQVKASTAVIAVSPLDVKP